MLNIAGWVLRDRCLYLYFLKYENMANKRIGLRDIVCWDIRPQNVDFRKGISSHDRPHWLFPLFCSSLGCSHFYIPLSLMKSKVLWFLFCYIKYDPQTTLIPSSEATTISYMHRYPASPSTAQDGESPHFWHLPVILIFAPHMDRLSAKLSEHSGIGFVTEETSGIFSELLLSMNPVKLTPFYVNKLHNKIIWCPKSRTCDRTPNKNVKKNITARADAVWIYTEIKGL